MPAEPEYDNTADLLERLGQQTYRMTYGIPAPAAELRAAAVKAAPEFDRVWNSGRKPAMRLARLDEKGREDRRGVLAITISDGGERDAS